MVVTTTSSFPGCQSTLRPSVSLVLSRPASLTQSVPELVMTGSSAAFTASGAFSSVAIKAGQDPILNMLGSADCTDEQLFKTMAMFWQFERSVGALHGTWLLGYTFGSKGEYQEVEYLEIRQMYDEYKHARMYEDAMLQLGYVDSRASCSPIRGASSHLKHSACTPSCNAWARIPLRCARRAITWPAKPR